MYYPSSTEEPATPNHLDLFLVTSGSTSGLKECQEPTWTGYEDGSGVDINTPPKIVKPADRTYLQGETIGPFGIIVTDDEDSPLVTVDGLPDALAYVRDGSMTSGTVDADAEVGDYLVTITASDGRHTVTETFTVTVRPPHSSAGSAGLNGSGSGSGTVTAAGSGTAKAAPSVVRSAAPSDPTPGLTLAAPISIGVMGIEDLPVVPISVILLMLLLFLLFLAARRRKESDQDKDDGSDPRDPTGGNRVDGRPVGARNQGTGIESPSPLTAFKANNGTGWTTTVYDQRRTLHPLQPPTKARFIHRGGNQHHGSPAR